MASDILNKDLHAANGIERAYGAYMKLGFLHGSLVHSCNPGLEYIWREEAARCEAQGRKLEDTFNNCKFFGDIYQTNAQTKPWFTKEGANE